MKQKHPQERKKQETNESKKKTKFLNFKKTNKTKQN